MHRIVDQLRTSPIKQKPRIVKQDLIDYYRDISSQPGGEKIGIECEKIGVDVNTGQNIPYYGTRGFLNILKRLVQELGWDVVVRNGRNILELKRRDTRLTLESDGRIELSGHVHDSIHDLYREFFLHRYEISIISNMFNIIWLGIGMTPLSPAAEIELIPKTRVVMTNRYWEKIGGYGINWSRQTASIHANVDYHSEADLVRKFQAMLKIGPIITGIFANSPIWRGRLTDNLCNRMYLALHSDPIRFDSDPFFFDPDFSIEKWVDYSLKVPMMFLKRKNTWYEVPRNFTFGEFLRRGFRSFRPTIEDFILHESTIYTDVRIKKYIEIRCCDAVPPVLVASFPALIKGLVYHPDGLDAIDRMTRGWDYNTVQRLRHRVAKNALQVRVNRVRLFDLARELLDIADANLKSMRVYNIREEDESIYLHPLREFLIESKMCPARLIAVNWETKWDRNIHKLIEFCAY